MLSVYLNAGRLEARGGLEGAMRYKVQTCPQLNFPFSEFGKLSIKTALKAWRIGLNTEPLQSRF